MIAFFGRFQRGGDVGCGLVGRREMSGGEDGCIKIALLLQFLKVDCLFHLLSDVAVEEECCADCEEGCSELETILVLFELEFLDVGGGGLGEVASRRSWSGIQPSSLQKYYNMITCFQADKGCKKLTKKFTLTFHLLSCGSRITFHNISPHQFLH